MLAVEADLVARLDRRAGEPAEAARLHATRRDARLDAGPAAAVVAALAGDGPLLVVEGAAGAGKTTTLAAARTLLARRGHRLMVVTPTLKAAEVAARETGAARRLGRLADPPARLALGRRRPLDPATRQPRDPAGAGCGPGTCCSSTRPGMLDQDTARALLTLADETGARVAFVGDRHQLPAVGRGGVLDHAAAWAHPTAVLTWSTVHRFTDPDYADLSLRMRTGRAPATSSTPSSHAARSSSTPPTSNARPRSPSAGATGDLVVADTREQVADLNAAIRDRTRQPPTSIR